MRVKALDDHRAVPQPVELEKAKQHIAKTVHREPVRRRRRVKIPERALFERVKNTLCPLCDECVDESEIGRLISVFVDVIKADRFVARNYGHGTCGSISASVSSRWNVN